MKKYIGEVEGIGQPREIEGVDRESVDGIFSADDDFTKLLVVVS